MNIKKSRLIICAIAMFLIGVIFAICLVNPFGIKNIGKFLKFSYISRMIEDNYYEDMDLSSAADGAIAGVALSTKDPYTMYLWGDSAEEYAQDMRGDYCGIGVHAAADTEGGFIYVESVIPATPAEMAGIKPGDILLKVDGKECKATELTSIADNIKGEEGTNVKIEVLKLDGTTKEYEITRRNVETGLVYSEVLDGGIGYISISQFTENISDKFLDKCREMEKNNVNSLIIDLRNNPGGLMNESVRCTSAFLDDGTTITYTLDKNGKKDEYKSVNTNIKLKLPIVVLVNDESASASEIMTGALHDYSVATIVGKKTFGKGIVQSVYSFDPESILSVTVSRYYTPNGVCIHGIGIEPDVDVDTDPSTVVTYRNLNLKNDMQLKEAIKVLKK